VYAGGTTRTVYVHVTLTRSKVNVKVTGLLNFRQLAKPCLLAAMTAAPLQSFLFYYSIRVVNIWNSLPNWVVSANTANTFKARLDKFWHNQDIIYNFRAQLQVTGSHSEFLYEES